MRFLRLATACALVLPATLVLTPSVPAVAYDLPQDRIVSANPADWTPDVVSSGGVRYLARTGTTMVAGGNFSEVRNPGTSTILRRTNLFAFDYGTGLVKPGFAPVLDGMVHTLVVAPGGQQVIVGGEFKRVNGVPKIGLVALDLDDGSISTAVKTPTLNGRVFTMKYARGKVYIGGGFTTAGGQPIGHLAAFDPQTGAVDATQAVTFSGVNHPNTNPGTTLIVKIDISPDGRRLAAIGNFSHVNGADRPQAVQLDLGTPKPTVLDWVTDRYRAPCLTTYQTYMHDVEFSPDGSYFVIVTTGGGYSGGGGSVIGCDSTARWDTDVRGTSLQPQWITFTGNDTLWSVAVTGTAVYTGGHNRWQNNAWGSDRAGPGAVSRPGLSALDPLSGRPFDWNPGRITGVGVFDMVSDEDGLWIGHDTNYVGGEYRHKIAYFPLAGGKTPPDVFAGSLPGEVVQLGTGATASGTPGSCGSVATPGAADIAQRRPVTPGGSPVVGSAEPVPPAGRAWNQVRGAFMLSGTLYTGWASGELCASSFNGTTFGPPTPVELYNNKLIGELPTVTAMFFADNRIYFTRSGSKTLWYRHFVPQSRIVGDVAYVASGNVTGIDFSTVNGMFLSGNHLYYGVRSDRTLRRIDWNGTAPVGGGTAVTVSGPAQDGVSWAQSGMFLYSAAGTGAPNKAPRATVTAHCSGLTCDFGSTGSIDPDGLITDFAWEFGDGATASGPGATHTYAEAGTHILRLRVTDDDGRSTSTTRELTLGAPRLAPSAAFTVSCRQLTCDVDAGTSSDADGSIESYRWDFGDGTSGTTRSESHTYGTDGSYTIRLTVTDNDGLSDVATKAVNVAAATSGITFLGSSHVNQNASSWTVTVPSSVVGGDGLLLAATTTATSLSNPSGDGWSLVGTRTVGGGTTKVWQKTAAPSDGGSKVRLTTPSTVKTAVTLLAYRGTAPTPVAAVAHSAETVSRTSHTTPTVGVPATGSRVVSLWGEKSSATSTYTPPGGVTVRAQSCSRYSGHVCQLVTEHGPVQGGSTAGGLTATADTANSAVSLWTVVLAPAG